MSCALSNNSLSQLKFLNFFQDIEILALSENRINETLGANNKEKITKLFISILGTELKTQDLEQIFKFTKKLANQNHFQKITKIQEISDTIFSHDEDVLDLNRALTNLSNKLKVYIVINEEISAKVSNLTNPNDLMDIFEEIISQEITPAYCIRLTILAKNHFEFFSLDDVFDETECAIPIPTSKTNTPKSIQYRVLTKASADSDDDDFVSPGGLSRSLKMAPKSPLAIKNRAYSAGSLEEGIKVTPIISNKITTSQIPVVSALSAQLKNVFRQTS